MKREMIKIAELGQNVLTFGSCLSRFTAVALSHICGARPVCSVFNNRSDLFIRYFLEGSDLPLELGQVKAAVPLERDQEMFFLRQKRNWLGLYNPIAEKQKNVTLWTCLERQNIGLIIADNYMDMTARDACLDVPGCRDIRFFLPSKRTGQEKLLLGDYLDVEKSAENLGRIVAFLRDGFPRAKIVFLHFPYETYAVKPHLEERFRRFNEIFTCDPACLTVETHILSDKMKTASKQHFNCAFYAAVAGQIYRAVI